MTTRKKVRMVRPQLHRPPMHLPRCPVEGKLCFPDEDTAAAEIFECRMLQLFHGKKRRKETRSYLCDHCEAFHLTAMAVPPSHVGAAHGDGVHMAPQNKDRRRQAPRPAAQSRPSGSGYSGGSDYTSSFASDYGSGSAGDWSSSDSSSSSSSSSSSCADTSSSSFSSSDSGC